MGRQDVGLTAQQVELSSDVDPVLLADGLEMIRQEKAITFREAFRHHWRAVLWSIALSMGCVMDGEERTHALAQAPNDRKLMRHRIRREHHQCVLRPACVPRALWKGLCQGRQDHQDHPCQLADGLFHHWSPWQPSRPLRRRLGSGQVRCKAHICSGHGPHCLCRLHVRLPSEP